MINAEPSLDNLYERVDSLQDDQVTLAIYNNYKEELEPILERVLGRTIVDLEHDRYAEPSLLGEWICDVMRNKADVQIAMTNGGGLRASMPAGEITAGELYEVMPFDNTLYTMRLSDSDIKKNIEHVIMNENVG